MLVEGSMIPFQGAKAFHLLWALMFLKLYAAECVLASIAAVNEKTYRKWAWAFVDALADLHTQVVSSCWCWCGIHLFVPFC